MSRSIIKVRRGAHDMRYLTIPKAILAKMKLASGYMVADLDEDGNLVYCPVPPV